jgi:hypothetical protein
VAVAVATPDAANTMAATAAILMVIRMRLRRRGKAE